MEFMKYAYFNEAITEFDNAKVSIAAHSLQYGTLAFGGIRGYYRNGKVAVFRLKDHYIRLMNASKMLGFEAPSNMLFVLTIFIAFYLIFNLTTIISQENKKNVLLVQKVSLLKKKVKELEEKMNDKKQG